MMMHIDIQARRFPLTKALNSYVAKKIKSTLSNFNENRRLKSAVVRLSDVNGPKGGEDKLCQVQVKLVGMPDIIIKSKQKDMYAAIDRALHRAGHIVARRVGRLKKQDKQPNHIASRRFITA
jgi:ribosomal subunit interface protein